MTVTEKKLDPIRDVLNQAPPLENFNAFESNQPLVEATEREGAGWAIDRLRAMGKIPEPALG